MPSPIRLFGLSRTEPMGHLSSTRKFPGEIMARSFAGRLPEPEEDLVFEIVELRIEL